MFLRLCLLLLLQTSDFNIFNTGIVADFRLAAFFFMWLAAVPVLVFLPYHRGGGVGGLLSGQIHVEKGGCWREHHRGCKYDDGISRACMYRSMSTRGL